MRATSDGHVIVGAGARQKVYAFDSTLKSFTIVVDSGAGTGTIPIRTTGVIPYLADSTLLPDFSATVTLVPLIVAIASRPVPVPAVTNVPAVGVMVNSASEPYPTVAKLTVVAS